MHKQTLYRSLNHLYRKGYAIHGWWINATTSGPERPRTLLILHGRSLPIPVYRPLIEQLAAEGLNVFLFDYQGFGKSNGTPTEENMNSDAETALAYAAQRDAREVQYTRSKKG